MNIDTGHLVPAPGAPQPLRLPRCDSTSEPYGRSSYTSTTANEKRLSMIVAGGLHIGLFSLMMYGLAAPVVQPGPPALQVTYIDLGNSPPPGDPNGDEAPMKAQPEPQPEPIETPPQVEPTEDEQNKTVEPAISTPEAEDLPAETTPRNPAENTSFDFTDTYGSGTLALGAKVHGDRGGLDGDLAAAVGRMIATRIKTCWDAPTTGLPDALAITMTVTFDQNGALTERPIIARLVDETKTVVEEPNKFEKAAIAAVDRCSPLNLPQHLFAYWHQVDIEIFSARPVNAGQANSQPPVPSVAG